MELPEPEQDQISDVPQLKEKNVNQLSEELHLLKQHVDHQFARVELMIDREREHTQRLIAELKAALVELINEKFDAARK